MRRMNSFALGWALILQLAMFQPLSGHTAEITQVAQTGKITATGCLTESALKEFIAAAGRNDKRQGKALLASVCVFLENREFSVIEMGFSYSKIRVYAGKGSVVLWVISEQVLKGTRG